MRVTHCLPLLPSRASYCAGVTRAATPCAELVHLKIPASGIGLASGGAVISSAGIATVPADPAKPEVTREYCKVLGAVQPVDPEAPSVNFQVNLPVQWNGKAVQYGGGGSNGVLITGLNALRDARADTPVPVARGFATWGTDAGHDNRKLVELRAFALNDESLVNMAYASYKKTRDVGVRIATAFYGRAPAKLYFFGGSEGGREALLMAQRYPKDFDGIVSVVPVVNYTGANLVQGAARADAERRRLDQPGEGEGDPQRSHRRVRQARRARGRGDRRLREAA